jgi:CBS domain-containing protein
MITVSEFMTKDLVTVREGDDLALAESLLKLSGVRHLPVVRDGRLVGMLTPRDLLASGHAGRPSARDAPVGQAMVKEPGSVVPSTSLAAAARIMLEKKLDCLPVCEEGGPLLGLITEADFVRFAADVVRDLDLVAEAVRAQALPPSA